MSTKDFLKGVSVAIIPYCKGRKADAVGDIEEVMNDAEGDYYLCVKTSQGQTDFDLLGNMQGEVCRLLDGRPVLVRERGTGDYCYVIRKDVL